jgi:putative hydrolase of the HAD superfamily
VTARLRCRALFLDAGGVLVLPDRRLLARALATVGIEINPAAVPSAPYRAVRTMDRTAKAARPTYAAALFTQLGIVPGRAAEALAVWKRLADRARSGEVLWREPTPGAHDAIASFQRAGLPVVIVTNSDGHGEENLSASGFATLPVVDSTVVGAAKPDPRIFEIALGRTDVRASEAVHVGDTLGTDIAGAHAAGITPIHLDPLRGCRARDHRHVRSLAGVWRHLEAPQAPLSRPIWVRMPPGSCARSAVPSPLGCC